VCCIGFDGAVILQGGTETSTATPCAGPIQPLVGGQPHEACSTLAYPPAASFCIEGSLQRASALTNALYFQCYTPGYARVQLCSPHNHERDTSSVLAGRLHPECLGHWRRCSLEESMAHLFRYNAQNPSKVGVLEGTDCLKHE
jgi:hypothetical protein